MGNKKFIFVVAIFFSFVFGLGYYFIFTNFVSVREAVNIYMNQVGLYKSAENAANVVATLKEQEFDCFTMKKDDLIAVVCSLSDQKEETVKQQEQLTNLGYTYIEKSISIENREIIDLLHEKEFTKALEMINDESKRNDNE